MFNIYSSINMFNIFNTNIKFCRMKIITKLSSMFLIQEVLLLDENVSPVQPLVSTDNTSVVMKDVSASWETGAETICALHDINIQQKAGQLYAVVGSVGAGKVYKFSDKIIH